MIISWSLFKLGIPLIIVSSLEICWPFVIKVLDNSFLKPLTVISLPAFFPKLRVSFESSLAIEPRPSPTIPNPALH